MATQGLAEKRPIPGRGRSAVSQWGHLGCGADIQRIAMNSRNSCGRGLKTDSTAIFWSWMEPMRNPETAGSGRYR